MNKVAVAMSVYKGDKLEYLELSVDSIISQTYKNIHLFIQVDGQVSAEISAYLQMLTNINSVSVEFVEKNMGLAWQLNRIIDKAEELGDFTYLARMDADDISSLNRFKQQVDFLINNPEVGVVGSDVIEINDDGIEVFYKKMGVSHDDLFKKIIKKCPFNHPTVMFRMSIFSELGFRYDSKLMNTQDYYLWVDLLSSGIKFANISQPLLMFRINNSFHSRRGFKKAANDLKSRLYAFQKLDVLSVGNVFHVFLLFCLRIAPPKVKKIAYEKFR